MPIYILITATSISATLLCVFLLLGIGTITATAPAPAPTTSCVKVDGCALDLITSVFNRRISLSTQCCQGFSTISDDCFYKEFTHSKRVPFFLGKVRNYCSHAVSNAASPTHVASSPDVVSPSNMAPSPAPTTSCIKKECAINLITSVFRHKILLSTQCCQVLSTISNDCFYRGFTHSKLQEGTVFPRQSERLLRCGFTNSCGSISIAGL